MDPALRLLALFLFGVGSTVAQPAAPGVAMSMTARAQENAPGAEEPDWMVERVPWIAAVDRLLAGGEREAARARLEALLEDGTDSLVEGLEPLEGALLFARLDRLAGAVGSVTAGIEVREALVRWCDSTLAPDNPERMRVRASLGSTLRIAGELSRSLELLEEVVAGWEATHPADDPFLASVLFQRGLTRAARGATQAGADDIERALAVWSQHLPATHPQLRTAKRQLARVRRDLGDLRGACAMEEELLAALHEAHPSGHEDVLRATENLANQWSLAGELDRALELGETALSERRRLHAPEHPAVLHALDTLGVILSRRRELEAALEIFEELASVRSRLLSPDDPTLLSTRQSLALVQRELGDVSGAAIVLEDVCARAERVLPPDHRVRLAVRDSLAMTLLELGEYERAVELLEGICAAHRRSVPPEHPRLLGAQKNLALAQRELGALEEACTGFEDVLAVYERTLGPEDPRVLSTRLSLAWTLFELGEVERARTQAEHVYAVWRLRLPPGHTDLMGATGLVATIRRRLGDYPGARVLQERVYERCEQLDRYQPRRQSAAVNLAITLIELGEHQGARELLEEVLAARVERLGPEHPDLLNVQANLATALRGLGDVEAAHAIRERVLLGWRGLRPPGHPDVLDAIQNLAVTTAELGDYERSRELHTEVLEGRERSLSGDSVDVLAARQNLLGVLAQLDDASAWTATGRTLLAGQLARASTLALEAPRSARAAALVELDRLEDVLALVESVDGVGASQLDADAFATLEALRCVSTVSGAVARATASTPELRALRSELSAARRALSDLSQAGPSETSHDVWRDQLLAQLEERDRLERAERAALAELGLEVQAPSVKQVADGLAADAALATFLMAEETLTAFVLTPNGDVRRVDLGNVVALEQRVGAWRSAVGRPVDARAPGVGLEVEDPETPDPVQRASEELRRALLDPVRALVPDARTLHVVADDLVHLVPLDALALDGAPLGDHLVIRNEVSTERLARAHARNAAESLGPARLVALGGIDYSAEPLAAVSATSVAAPPTFVHTDAVRAGVERFAPLPATEAEAWRIAELFALRDAANESSLLTGSAATKRALVEAVAGARFVHVATHGWFTPRSQAASMLDEGGSRSERADAAARTQDMIVGFLPETLCGLALAGANHGADASGRVPGVLTAEELATLDLMSCELAVLSACETNVGVRRAGQGIQSLQTALHAAGARTAITSLWKVSDQATRRLFELFYGHLWENGLGKADALWQAKTTLREEGYPLRDWAGWVLTGDPD